MLDGRQSLLTPEGVSIYLVPAGPGKRAFAWALDFVIWFAANVFIINFLQSAIKLEAVQGVYLVFLFVSYWGYPVLCEVYAGGKTVGKLALGLEVVKANGLPVGWRESITRNLLLAADFLPFCYASGLIAMMTDRQFRRLGDLVAGTLVIHRTKEQKRLLLKDVESIPLPFPLTPTQQRALLDFQEREHRLPKERAIELANLATPLTGATGGASLHRLRGLAAGLLGQ